eukprot:1559661-Prymnesium_polylepis.1
MYRFTDEASARPVQRPSAADMHAARCAAATGVGEVKGRGGEEQARSGRRREEARGGCACGHSVCLRSVSCLRSASCLSQSAFLPWAPQ